MDISLKTLEIAPVVLISFLDPEIKVASMNFPKKLKQQGPNFSDKIKQQGLDLSAKLSNSLQNLRCVKGSLKYCVAYKTY